MKTPIAFHLTARTARGNRPFTQRANCVILWNKLQQAFPRVYAAVIMPNHFHLVIPATESSNAIRWRMGVLLRSVSRTVGPRFGRWEPAPEPEAVTDRVKAQFAIRYVHLNPVRAQLVRDPLSWEWSGLREIAGANLGLSWLDRTRLAGIHEVREGELWQKMHLFTARDPFCAADAVRPVARWDGSMRLNAAQIAGALLVGSGRVQLDTPTLRGLWARACLELGGMSVSALARDIGLTRRGAQKAIARARNRGSLAQWNAVRTLLAEPRFRSQGSKNSQECERADG